MSKYRDKIFPYFISVLVLAGIMPVLLHRFGVYFIPSEDYYVNFSGYAKLIAFSIFAISAIYMMVGKGFPVLFFNKISKDNSESKSAFAIIALGGFVYFSAYCAVIEGVPLIGAIIFGKPTALQFSVEKASGFSDSKCPREIKLNSMPLILGSVCGASQSFRETLERGDRIELFGRGTSYGIFYRDARKLDTRINPQI